VFVNMAKSERLMVVDPLQSQHLGCAYCSQFK